MGHPVTATGCAGGRTGADIRADLDARGVAHRFVDGAADSRRTVTVVSAAHGDATVLNEPGPEVPARSGASLGEPRWPTSCASSAPAWWCSPAACRGVCPPTRYSRPGRRRSRPRRPGRRRRRGGGAAGRGSRPGRRSSSPTGTSCCRPPAAPTSPPRWRRCVPSAPATSSCRTAPTAVLVFPPRGRRCVPRLPEPLAGNPTGAGDALRRGARSRTRCRDAWPVVADGPWPGRPPRCCSRWPGELDPDDVDVPAGAGADGGDG